MNIIIIGRGVIATIYGKIFTEAGHAVRHLVRPGRSAQLGHDLSVELLDGRNKNQKKIAEKITTYAPDCFERFEELAPVDLVFACVRSDQMAGLVRQLISAPLPRGGIVFFNNCWDDPVQLTAGLPAEKVLWAFPMAGGGFAGDARLACALQPVIHMETASGKNRELGRLAAEVFASSGLAITRHVDMRAWLWRHFALNAGFMALTLARGCGMEKIMDSSADLTDGLKLVREATLVAEARGIGPKSESGESTLARLPFWLARAILRSTFRSSRINRRMMTIHGKRETLVDVPLRVIAEARRLGLPCPGLEAAIEKINTNQWNSR